MSDLSGQKFSRLTVLRLVSRKNGNPFWLCRCICGNIRIVKANNLKTGNTKSCGCLRSEMLSHGLHARCMRTSRFEVRTLDQQSPLVIK